MVADAWGFAPAPENCHVFLCGNPLMIIAMKDLLLTEGFTLHHRRSPGTVHVEEF